MSISVAIAAYMGEKYIEEQLRSVLVQLGDGDEVVVSLDPSSDRTGDIIASLSREFPSLRTVTGPGRGIVANFGSAIAACRGDFIFLCDQDDIWLDGKVKEVLSAFDSPDVVAVMHDARIVDGELNELLPSFFGKHGRHRGTLGNLVRNSYIGCCMAFRRELCDVILPLPGKIPMHDSYIGICAGRCGRVAFIDRPLILWRRHGANASGETHSGLVRMIRWRINLASVLIGSAGACRRLKATLAGERGA